MGATPAAVPPAAVPPEARPGFCSCGFCSWLDCHSWQYSSHASNVHRFHLCNVFVLMACLFLGCFSGVVVGAAEVTCIRSSLAV